VKRFIGGEREEIKRWRMDEKSNAGTDKSNRI
jgi:hypothetical protein